MQRKGKIHSPNKQKILLLLDAGFKLGFTRSLGKQKKIWRTAAKAWGEIDERLLSRHIEAFHNDRLVDYQEQADGSIKVVLSENGQRRILFFKIDKLKLKPAKHWDGKWRFVAYDIPHDKSQARHALLRKLKELGFYQWQKSVLVYPYDCRDEIDFITEFFEIRPHVRYAEMINPTNESELGIKFKL